MRMATKKEGINDKHKFKMTLRRSDKVLETVDKQKLLIKKPTKPFQTNCNLITKVAAKYNKFSKT